MQHPFLFFFLLIRCGLTNGKTPFWNRSVLKKYKVGEKNEFTKNYEKKQQNPKQIETTEMDKHEQQAMNMAAQTARKQTLTTDK